MFACMRVCACVFWWWWFLTEIKNVCTQGSFKKGSQGHRVWSACSKKSAKWQRIVVVWFVYGCSVVMHFAVSGLCVPGSNWLHRKRHQVGGIQSRPHTHGLRLPLLTSAVRLCCLGPFWSTNSSSPQTELSDRQIKTGLKLESLQVVFEETQRTCYCFICQYTSAVKWCLQDLDPL